MNRFSKADAGRIRFVAALVALLLAVTSCDRIVPTASTPRVGTDAVQPHFVVNPGEYVKLYVEANPNDWSNFMGDRVVSGLQTVSNIVWVYVSAGDANRSTTFWHLREQASQAAMDTVLGPGAWSCAGQTFQGHPIWRCVKGRAAAYYMRLPDGSPSGEGYAARGSMGNLRDGFQPSITTLDSSTTYTSWTDFYTTVRSIIDFESGNQSAPYVEVSAPDYDRAININATPDNFAVADAVRAVTTSRTWNLVWFTEQNIQYRPINLSQAQHDVKAAAFYAYDNFMGKNGWGYNQFESDYQAFLWRSYFRTSVSVPVPPPATPQNLTAQASSGTRIDLSWTTASTNGTGFYVERAPDNAGVAGPFVQVASVPISTTSYSSTGLSSNTRYWFRVRAYNSSDVSPYSTSASAVTFVVPAAPANVQATALSTTRVQLTWTNNATNATATLVERAPDNAGSAGPYAQIASLGPNALTYDDTGLGANTRYWYRIRAVNATDSSAYAPAPSVLTPSGPAAPSNLQASALSATRIDLHWTNNAVGTTGITVERAPDNGGVAGTYAAVATLGATAVGYSDLSVLENTRYWYHVRAFNAVDVSAYSAPATATTPPLPPAAPTNLQATVVSSARIDLSWTDNASNESGFYIERAPDNAGVAGPFAQIASVGSNVVNYSNTLLSPSTRYWYRTRAFNAAASSAYTNTVSATTSAPPTARNDFYIHAHQDDWQLFMGERAYSSVQSATKVVFVQTTAGDGGQNATFWQTRELAAQAAVDAFIGAGSWSCAPQTVNGHAIRRCAKGKAVSYDLRLPDGATSGEGFSGHGSMSLLRDGSIASLRALDGSATYTSWTDFSRTLGGIIDLESGSLSAPYVEVNAPEYDRTLNPSDHADHTATADAVRATATLHSWNVSWYVDYQIKNRAVNLTQAAHDVKQQSFYAYDNYMGAAGYGRNQYESDYQAWLWRSYFRSQTP